MGNGMNKVLPGLYVGNYRDSKDPQQLDRYNISHIVAIHDSPRRLIADKHYLCVMAADTPDQNLSQYFSVCNDFIHAARLRDGNVLIHCLAGMSRSVTVAVAYIMSVTSLSWKEALKVVRAGRAVANPNAGFQTQLQEFENTQLLSERKRLKERYPSAALTLLDREQCALALNNYAELLSNKDICEGNCVRGQDCPTGMCRADTSKGILRRKASNASVRSNRLTPSTSQSCPTSPRYGTRGTSQKGHSRTGSGTINNRRDSELSQKNDNFTIEAKPETNNKSNSTSLQRSASAVSNLKGGYSPSGFRSYTGSAPPSVHGSRVDLSNPANTGSAIYLGFTPTTRSNFLSGSTFSINSKSSLSGASLPPTPVNTPPASPKHSSKRIVAKK